MSYQLRIAHDSGGETVLSLVTPDDVGNADVPSVVTLSTTRVLDRQPSDTDEAEVAVYRDAWREIESALDAANDRFIIEDDTGERIFGGRLRDDQSNGSVVSVLLDGPKRDANDGAISGPAESYGPQGDDTTLETLIARTPTVSLGAVDAQKIVSFGESNAAPGKSITKLARATGAETIYRPDWTLDYVDRLGSDRETVLSPANGTIISEPRKRRDDRENVTHVTVLGAGEGTAQTRAEAVADDYSPGDRRIDRTVTDKDIRQDDRAQALADEVIAEIDAAPRHIDLEFEVPREIDPSLGDSFRIELPELGIDDRLRIMELERIIDELGDRFNCVFSSRKLTRERDADAQAREVEDLSEGNAGQYFAIQDSEGYDAIGDESALDFPFFRPENVVGEFRATLRLDSRPYRARTRGAAAGGGAFVTSESGGTNDDTTGIDGAIFDTTDADGAIFQSTADNADFSNVADSSSGRFSVDTSDDPTIDFYSPSVATSFTLVRIAFGPDEPFDDDSLNYTWTLRDDSGTIVDEVETEAGTPTPDTSPYTAVTLADFSDVSDDTLELQVSAENNPSTFVSLEWISAGPHDHTVDVSAHDHTIDISGHSHSFDWLHDHAIDVPDHEHDLVPGIIDFLGETVSNVSVEVNGDTVASGLDSPLSESIDLTGVLDGGRNDIVVRTDTLGEVRATVVYEGVKNAGEN